MTVHEAVTLCLCLSARLECTMPLQSHVKDEATVRHAPLSADAATATEDQACRVMTLYLKYIVVSEVYA